MARPINSTLDLEYGTREAAKLTEQAMINLISVSGYKVRDRRPLVARGKQWGSSLGLDRELTPAQARSLESAALANANVMDAQASPVVLVDVNPAVDDLATMQAKLDLVAGAVTKETAVAYTDLTGSAKTADMLRLAQGARIDIPVDADQKRIEPPTVIRFTRDFHPIGVPMLREFIKGSRSRTGRLVDHLHAKASVDTGGAKLQAGTTVGAESVGAGNPFNDRELFFGCIQSQVVKRIVVRPPRQLVDMEIKSWDAPGGKPIVVSHEFDGFPGLDVAAGYLEARVGALDVIRYRVEAF